MFSEKCGLRLQPFNLFALFYYVIMNKKGSLVQLRYTVSLRSLVNFAILALKIERLFVEKTILTASSLFDIDFRHVAFDCAMRCLNKINEIDWCFL